MGSLRTIIFIAIVVTCMVGSGSAGRFKTQAYASASASSSASGDGNSEATSSATSSSSTTALDSDSSSESDKDEENQCRAPPKFSTPQECARECKVGEPPKICHYTFHVEYYATLTDACMFCNSTKNTRVVDDCQCLEADHYEFSGMITVNRMYPGPSIVVCENDLVVVDVVQQAPGQGVTIHWHGILQQGSQYYDGVPFVTQCPITDGSTFRYQWKATNAGTHFWHAHTGLQKAAGLDGAIVIREPKKTEINNELWDLEELEHVIFITDFLHSAPEEHYPGTLRNRPGQLPDNFLINGRGRWKDPESGNTTAAPLSVFKVKPGNRYRIRMINACAFVCPVTLTIENHDLTVFSLDGEPIEPVVVDSITSFSAERYDFVINANEKHGDYWIQVRAIGECESKKINQLAILRYESKEEHSVTHSPKPTFENGLDRGVILNELNVRCDGLQNSTNVVCIPQLKSVEPVPPSILKKTADKQYFMPFGFYTHNQSELFKPGSYSRFLVTNGREFSSLVDHVSNIFPPSPLISQRDDNPPDQICEPEIKPKHCVDNEPCTCTHVYEIPLNAVVELILVDESRREGLSHPFHLHGGAFHVLGEGCGDDYNNTKVDVDFIKYLDKTGQLHRNFDKPPAKDTYALLNNGYTVIRFVASNPGYWLFHCHYLPHLSDGMSAIFHVGTHEDLPPIPKGFPKCGNFLPDVELWKMD